MASPALQSVLVIGKVWPEHSSTAAGVRTAQLISLFRKRGVRVTVASPAKPNEFSEELQASGVPAVHLPLNRTQAITKVLEESEPSICIFDRFTTEEAFSFHVRSMRPQCMRVLDTQDLHFLRAVRQKLADTRKSSILEIMRTRPAGNDPTLLRELSAIYRSDLSLICSRAELALLTREYGLPKTFLALASFFHPQPGPTMKSDTGLQSLASRRHFVFIGTFKHAPNVDGVQWLARDIWPLIRKQIPDAECHIYGSYATPAVSSLHKPKSGFHFKGHAASLDVLASYRVGLAPLSFGAGIKGKILDCWRYGTPVVTTPVGAEGLEDTTTSGHFCSCFSSSGGADISYESHKGSEYSDQVDACASAVSAHAGLRGEGSSTPEHAQRDPDAGPAAHFSAMGSEESGPRAGPDSMPVEWGNGWNSGRAGSEGSAFKGGLGRAQCAEEFASDAVRMYQDSDLWLRSQEEGVAHLSKWFDEERNGADLWNALVSGLKNLEENRMKNIVGGMLWLQKNRSTEYFSRWLELKEMGTSA